MQNSTQTKYHINSLARGLKILELLAQSREPLTFSRIAADMALTLPTVYRFLFTLESLGYVDKDPDMKSYRVSPKVLALEHISVAALNMAVNAAQYQKDNIHLKLAPIVKEMAHRIPQALGFYEEAGHG